MKIAFYGTAGHIGTSANMAAVAAGFLHYLKIPVFVEEEELDAENIVLIDCSKRKDAKEIIESCELLVLNLSIPCRELEKVYFRHSLVRKNVIFLIGKYYQDKPNELEQLAKQYRIPKEKVFGMLYNPRFQEAYEKNQVLRYLKGIKRYEDMEFAKNLKLLLDAMITYGIRKGDMYYG